MPQLILKIAKKAFKYVHKWTLRSTNNNNYYNNRQMNLYKLYKLVKILNNNNL